MLHHVTNFCFFLIIISFLPHLSSILLSSFLHILSSTSLVRLSNVPSCRDIQIPRAFRVEADDISTKRFLKQTLSHSSSVLKLTPVDGPSLHNNFGDGALKRYKGVCPRDTSVSSRYKSVFLPVPQCWIVVDDFLMSKSHSIGTKGCNLRAHNPSRPCQSIWFPINQLWHHSHRFVGFLSFWLFL